MATDSESVIASVKDYYGKKLKTVEDLQTQACVTPGRKVNKQVKDAIAAVHDAVASRYYGCGIAIPQKLENMKVLDLGSGSGRDCYAISKLVGPNGFVTGIDMTDEQIEVSRQYIDHHTEKFGYSKPNIKFVQGYIESLTVAGLLENSFDIVVSNCTVNLTPDKRAVFREAYKVLKSGGEFYFSDLYVDRNLDEKIRKHKVLWGEGYAGALFWKDLHSIAKETGFSPVFLVSATAVPVDRDDFKAILGDTKYASVTYRFFKLPAESDEENTQVTYKGGITSYKDGWSFDYKTSFKTGEIVTVDGEIATCLKNSRFSEEFDFHPADKTLCGSKKEMELEDPFEYLVEKEKGGKNTCCGSK